MRRRGEEAVGQAHLGNDRTRRHTWEGSLEADVLQLRDRAGQAEPDHAHAQAAHPVPADVTRSTPHPLEVLRHRVTPGHTAAYDRAVSRGDMRWDGCHSSPPICTARVQRLQFPTVSRRNEISRQHGAKVVPPALQPRRVLGYVPDGATRCAVQCGAGRAACYLCRCWPPSKHKHLSRGKASRPSMAALHRTRCEATVARARRTRPPRSFGMPLPHAQAHFGSGMPMALTHRSGRVWNAALPAERVEEPAVTCRTASTAQAAPRPNHPTSEREALSPRLGAPTLTKPRSWALTRCGRLQPLLRVQYRAPRPASGELRDTGHGGHRSLCVAA